MDGSNSQLKKRKREEADYSIQDLVAIDKRDIADKYLSMVRDSAREIIKDII